MCQIKSWRSQKREVHIPPLIQNLPVTKIERDAFAECTSLTSVTISGNVTKIEKDAFWGCDNLTAITVAANNPNYSSENGILYNKNKTLLHTYPAGKKGSFTILNSVTNIGGWAFSDCTSLTGVTIPNSVTSIGEQAFARYTSLTVINVVVNNSAYTSENGVLYNKNKILLHTYPAWKKGSFTIPNSVTSILEWAFSGCTGLTGVIIPNSVTSIGHGAFVNCTSLTGVTIPNSVTTIEEMAFLSCKSLTSVTIPNSVTSIGEYAFSGCIGLTSVAMPDSVEGISGGIFEGCTSLPGLPLPKSADVSSGVGKVILYSKAGFTMTDNNQVCHYLEAAPNDMPAELAWASSRYTETFISGTDTEFGAGRKNTALILAVDAAAPAAKACKDYSYGGKTDWFLPSRDELGVLYESRNFVGNMGTDWYWSSSQGGSIYIYSDDGAWSQRFSDGSQYYVNYKYNTGSVRAVRAF
jgi:hypothetical protein